MNDLDRLVGLARESARQVVARASECILAGAEADHVHTKYVVRALNQLEDVEAYAVLASEGDRAARSAIERIIRDLDALGTELEAEFPD